MALGSSEGGGASAGAVRAGGAFVEISANDSKLQQALAAAQARIQAFGKHVVRIGAVTAAAGGAILAPITASFWKSVDHAAEMGSLQKKFGGTVEYMSRLAYAFKTTGVDAEEFGNLIKHFQKTISDEAMSGKGGVLSQMGLDAKKLLDMPLQEQLDAWADSYKNLAKDADRTAASQHTFGRSGINAAKLMGGGSAGLHERMAQSDKVGATVTEEQARQATNVKKAWNEVKSSMEFALLAIGDALLPAGEMIAGYAKGLAKVAQEGRKWIEEHKELVQIITLLGIGLVTAGTAAMVLGKAISLMSVPLGLIGPMMKIIMAVGSTAISVLGAGFAFLASPIGLATAAVVALGAILLTQTETGREVTSEVGNAFQEMGTRLKAGFMETAQTAKEAFGGIVKAVQKGDLELAFSIAIAFLELEWAKLGAYWTRQWIKFKNFFIEGWHDLQAAVAIIGNAIGTGLEIALAESMRGVIWLFNNTIGQLVNGAAWLLDKVGLDDTAKKLREFSEIGTTWIDKWRADIDRGHNEEVDRIGKERADKAEGRRKFVEAEQADADNAMNEAKERLNELIAQGNAVAAAELLPMPRLAGYKPGGAGLQSPNIDYQKGLFQSPNFALALGIGEKRSPELKVFEKVKEGVDKAVAQLEEVNENFHGMKIARFA